MAKVFIWLMMVAFVIVNLIFADSIIAQDRGLTISPSQAFITITEDQAAYRHTIIVTNNTDDAAAIEMKGLDFGELEETGGVMFLGAESLAGWDEHRLTPWLKISPNKLNLDPGQQAEVVVNIANSADLTPGGHYAAIVATIANQAQPGRVAISPSLSSLMFVNKQGGEVYGLSTEDIDANISWWGDVDQAKVAFANTGNTHIAPRARLALKDPFQRVIATGVANQASTVILPQSSQDFTIQTERLGWAFWPGYYQLELAYRHDGQDEFQYASQTTFTIGIFGVMVMSLAGLGLVGWVIRKRFALDQTTRD